MAASSLDRKSTRLNSSHLRISYAVFCLKKKTKSDSTDPDVAARDTSWSPGNTDDGALVATCEWLRQLCGCGRVCFVGLFFFFLNKRGPPEISPFPLPAPFPF